MWGHLSCGGAVMPQPTALIRGGEKEAQKCPQSPPEPAGQETTAQLAYLSSEAVKNTSSRVF